MKKWYFKKYAKAHASRRPKYYKNKKLVKTTKIDWDGNKKRAYKWVKK